MSSEGSRPSNTARPQESPDKPIVYVDAKITGMHDKQLPKNAFVAYVVQGREDELSGVRAVQASKTDEAEEQAILFAIAELKGRLRSFTIIWNHESAVVKVNWKGNDRRKGKKDKVLPDIWKELDQASSQIEVQALKSNPAHGFLNRRLKEESTQV